MKLRLQAKSLLPGDVVGSGEKVHRCSAGISTPKGKVDVMLERDGKFRVSVWGAYTMINVEREQRQ